MTQLIERIVERLYRYRLVVILLVQTLLIVTANQGGFWLRFDGQVPSAQQPYDRALLPLLVSVRLAVFFSLRLHKGIWRYTSVWDLWNIIVGVTLSSVVFWAITHSGLGLTQYPRSVYVIDAVLLICLMGGLRMARRLYGEVTTGYGEADGKRVLVYGAGDAGVMIVHDMRRKPSLAYRPVGFIDDDRAKVGLRIHGVPVLGTRDDLPRIMAAVKPFEVLVAIPRADPTVFRNVVRALERYNIPIKTLPSLREILDNKVEINHVRKVSVEDLLSRGPVGLDPGPLRAFLSGRRVMVTGAGGSIGSELCRQIALFGCDALVLFDHAENGLFDVGNELEDCGCGTGIRAVVGDVTDGARVEQVLRRYRIEIVFHAAAHKHVPLMEANACEAVKNNVTGTRIMAETAERCGVDRFVFVSTDKAVNPTSVMGAVKRVSELLLLILGDGSGTTFLTVRFGNVLGSKGSVVPRFLQQIKTGGPVTVTHPDMRRFFMLIPEAVQLVLHAAARGEAGKLYVLDMGDPVRLVDMARHLIRLAGFIPEAEIPIKFVGLRPGEKLSEQLVGQDERASPSAIAGISELSPVASPVADVVIKQVDELERLVQQNDSDGAIAQLGAIVPAFRQNRERPPVLAETTSEALIARTQPTRATTGPADWAMGQVCPACTSPALYRSHARSRLEKARSEWSGKLLHRCHACGWRGGLTPIELCPDPLREEAATDHTDLTSLDEVVKVAAESGRPAFASRNLTLPYGH